MVKDSTIQWPRIIELTERMLRTAETAAWDELVQLEEERRALIYTDLPVLPADPQGQEAVKCAVQQILDTDRKVIDLCEIGQRELAEKIRSFQIGQRAQRAYGQAYRNL